MDTLKCYNLLLFFCVILVSCKRDRYYISNEPFDNISIRNWKSNAEPVKIVLEEFEANSNFNQRINVNSNFKINLDTLRNRLRLTPVSKKEGKIETDLKLTINDTLVFEISNIKTSSDTIKRTFNLGRTFHVYNALDTINVNGNLVYGKNTGHIKLYMEMAKVQKNVTTKKDTVFEKVERLSDLNMQKDTIYVSKTANLYFLDTSIPKGFLRTYYCNNNTIDSLKVKNNKIIEGLYLDGVVLNNIIEDGFSIFTYKEGLKNGMYVYIEREPVDFGYYEQGIKTGKSLLYFINGKWSGTVCIETYKNNEITKKSCDYHDWKKEVSKFLKGNKAKSIREFIFCQYRSDFYE
ncbi:hypothetical protein [uncultured Algibacter sp.]|uniref:hypothetical protein n=1 Tax=uncultured Algibacter sp. TaxID=298659 RepID=UPI003217B878